MQMTGYFFACSSCAESTILLLSKIKRRSVRKRRRAHAVCVWARTLFIFS